MSEGDQPPPRKPPDRRDRRGRVSVLDKAIVRRDLFNPENSVVFAPGALRHCPPLTPTAFEVAPSPPPEDQGLGGPGTELPARAEPVRPEGGRATKPRRRDSSEEDCQHDDKRQKILPLSPPLISTPATASRIPTRRGASTSSTALVRLPQPASPSPSPPRDSPQDALALPGPSGPCLVRTASTDSSASSKEVSAGEYSSAEDSTSYAALEPFAPSRDIPVPSPPSPTPSAAVHTPRQ